MPVFNYNEMQQLVAEVGHPDKVFIINQLPGMLVLIPEGWVHAVANGRHCFKIAIDWYHPERFHLYIGQLGEAEAVTAKRTAAGNNCENLVEGDDC